jgi:hypothetical protein
MEKAHLNLIKYALAQGCSISVHDGEEWQVKKSKRFHAIKSSVDSVEASTLRIRDMAGVVVAQADVVDCDEPDETLVDWSISPFMTEWNEQYSAIAWTK